MSTVKKGTKYEILITVKDVLANANYMDFKEYIYRRFFNDHHISINDFKGVEYHPIDKGMKVVAYLGPDIIRISPKKGFRHAVAKG